MVFQGYWLPRLLNINEENKTLVNFGDASLKCIVPIFFLNISVSWYLLDSVIKNCRHNFLGVLGTRDCLIKYY